MSDPRRWLDDAPSALTRELLLSASADDGSEQSKQRVRALLAAGAAVTAAAVAAPVAAAQAAAASATAASAGPLVAGAKAGVTFGVVTKVTGVAAVVAGVGLGTYVALEPSPPVPQISASSTARARAPVPVAPLPRSEPPLPEAVPEQVASASPSIDPRPMLPSPALPAPLPSSRTTAQSALADEVAAADAARRGLSRGDATALDAYLARYPTGAFREQMLVLRVQSLVRQGRAAEARARARAFVAAYPHSSHVPAMKRVIAP